MKIEFTALTRPLFSSGVLICTRVCRTTTLTMSAAPRTASAARESRKDRERPKTIVMTPNSATQGNIRAPARRASGLCASTKATTAAPTAGALRRRPESPGSGVQDVASVDGRSAVAPPNNTAKRSSEMAPRIGGREKTKRRPVESPSNPGSAAAATWSRARMREMRSAERRRSQRTWHRRRRSERVQEPADGRTGDGGNLERARVQRHGAGKVFPGHEKGNQGLARGAEERLPDADERHDGKYPARARAGTREMDEKKQGDDDLQAGSPPSRIVRFRTGLPRDRRAGQGAARDELGQAHHAEGERAPRQVVDMPPDRHSEHERGKRRQRARHEEDSKIPVSENAPQDSLLHNPPFHMISIRFRRPCTVLVLGRFDHPHGHEYSFSGGDHEDRDLVGHRVSMVLYRKETFRNRPWRASSIATRSR